MRAHEIMSRHIVTIRVDAEVIEAIKAMLLHRVSGLPVVDAGNKLVGIVSEGDFVRRTEIGTEKKRGRWLALLAGADRIAVDFVRQNGRKVSQIMTPDPITIGEDTPLEQIVRLMESRSVKRFPVLRAGEIVGMVTRADFLRAIASMGIVNSSDADTKIQSSVTTVLSHANWRPCALNVSVRDGVVTLKGSVKSDNAHRAAIVAAENVSGVRKIDDQLVKIAYPPPEDEYGGGDFVSLEQEAPTADDEPL